MRYLTLEWIKSHSRIDYDLEDELLTLYGDAAEKAVLNIIGRSLSEVAQKWGTQEQPVPAELMQATLMLVDASYTQRSPVSTMSLYAVPYSFDLLVKPYVKLSDRATGNSGILVAGYYDGETGLFYEDAAFERPITGDTLSLYKDLSNNLVYVYTGTGYELLNADMYAVTGDEMDEILTE